MGEPSQPAPSAPPPPQSPGAPQTNGQPNQTPKPGEAPSPPAPNGGAPPGPQPKAAEAVDPRLLQLAAQTRKLAAERMAWAEKMKTKEAELQASQVELDAWKKEREDRFRNPAKYLKAEYGEDWYDKLSKFQLSGEVTPGMVASEVDERVSAVEKRAQERIAALEKRLEEQSRMAADQDRQRYEAEAIQYVKSSPEKFPLVHAFELLENVPAVIRAHFEQTARQNEDGTWEPGELLTAEAAANMMEAHLEKRLSAAQEAKSKAQPAPSPPAAPGSSSPESVQRRTLSTDIQANGTKAPTPALTEAERKARAFAAWDAVVAQRNR